MYPDAIATKVALATLSKFLNMTLDLSGTDQAAEETKTMMESFGLTTNIVEEKKKEEDALRWYI